VVSVVAAEPHASGEIHAYAPSSTRAAVAEFEPDAVNPPAVVMISLDDRGLACFTNTAAAHIVVDIVGWVAALPQAPAPLLSDPLAPTAPECPDQQLFPHWQMVALYGNDRSMRLGALGEQAPDEAAARLGRLADSWRLGDRPVLPAFELIATLATADPGRDGLHRLVSTDDHVSRYLETARRHGIYLILDIQPGRSDFLTEAKRYESFLRQPDVGLALDPEWRTTGAPGGGRVGQVDAGEVNAVADWLASIVEEEQLPEKLLVVHQFQPRMLTNRDQVVAPDGIAIVIHMDGFGSRGLKQHSYAQVRAGAPLHMGLKLFYDEDEDLYQPAEILGGAFDPVPELVTYQ
jgi:hypothetical protein